MKIRTTLILAALTTACVSVSKTVLNEGFQDTPVPANRVDVLMASMGDALPEDCTRVAILHASGDQNTTDEGDFLKKLREEAGKLGANTVYVRSMEDAGTAERIVGAVFDVPADRDSEALALHCPTS